MYEFLKHKILILGMGEETFKKYSNIDTYDIYCWQNKWDKRMFKLCEHIPLKSISSWYAGWNYIDLKNYDTVIITDEIELLGERIPYDRIAQNIMGSKAILEIVEKG